MLRPSRDHGTQRLLNDDDDDDDDVSCTNREYIHDATTHASGDRLTSTCAARPQTNAFVIRPSYRPCFTVTSSWVLVHLFLLIIDDGTYVINYCKKYCRGNGESIL